MTSLAVVQAEFEEGGGGGGHGEGRGGGGGGGTQGSELVGFGLAWALFLGKGWDGKLGIPFRGGAERVF